jgi:hypothetical protein
MSELLNRIKNGEATWDWKDVIIHPITGFGIDDFKLKIFYMKDAMKLDGIRFPVSATEQQQIADLVNGIFHTERTQDLRHLNADTIIKPVIQVPPGSGKYTSACKDYTLYTHYINERINESANDKSNPGIVSSVGKPWTLTNNMKKPAKYGLDTAYNYGWYDPRGIYTSRIGKYWQPLISGTSKHVHNRWHKDASQVCEFLLNEAQLIYPDNSVKWVTLEEIYTSNKLCPFVTYDGKPLKYTRQPNVDNTADVIIMSPMKINA